MTIGIIIGSIRDGRIGAAIGEWVAELASRRTDAQFEIIDLKAFDVPLLTAAVPPAAAGRRYDSEPVRRWSRAIEACDGFVVVTPEYNHGVPGALKNAVDSLGPEWFGKVIGFVSYGADGGVRAVEQWRQIVANLQMFDVRAQVALSLFQECSDGFAPLDRRAGELTALLDQVVTSAARLGRSPS